MNHHSAEFLARDRIATMRQEARWAGGEPAQREPRRRPNFAVPASVRRLATSLATAPIILGLHR